jgi:glyoxylase-like metal-dependent hydrolase (beta-lactamase superfamily II)
MSSSLYLKQVELGPMENFVYLIGSAETREVAVVDPAWEVDTILKIAQQDDMNITKILVTHSHPDHTNGVEELMNHTQAKVYIHKAEAEFMKRVWSDLVKVESGEVVQVGNIPITFIHTPGHTPGSQCFFVDSKLISGDTLFIGFCGRCDLPGGSPEQMYDSLYNRLGKLDDRTHLYPGHNYGKTPVSTLADEKKQNPYLQFQSVKDFVNFRMRR